MSLTTALTSDERKILTDTEKNEIQEHDTINWIGEIVGGCKLTFDDEMGSFDSEESPANDNDFRPYCMIKFGDKILQKTLPAEGGRNPVWTVFTGAFFLIKATPKDLVQKKLVVSVWAKRRGTPLKLSVLESNVCMGKAELDLSKVAFNEERIDVTLRDGDCFESGMDRGTLTIRFRLSTEADERFLRLLKNRPELLRQRSIRSEQGLTQSEASIRVTESLLVTEANETDKAGETFFNAITSAFTSKKYFDKKAGQQKVLVKPSPDPNDIPSTTYLTAQDIAYLTMQPSAQWVEAGSGTLGKVYLEILSCKGLPNVDVGEAVGNVTDAFVSAVFEDAMVQTPVIDDELSPHWLPWTQRAFIFKMMHPASTLYLGAFDFDLGISNHQALGRVAVNISNLEKDTDYCLTYNLYPSSNVTDRTAAGTISVRIRIECTDEKEALIAALRPRPTFHINVRKEKSLSVLRYTCFGEYGDDNEHPFDLTVTGSYINEIFEYKRDIGYCLGDALRSLIFWRGQVRVVNMYVPLHSFLFFCFATTFVERPYMAPSFFLLSIAWIMLASLTQRRQHPSPWHQCHSFWNYVSILRWGNSTCSGRHISPNQSAAEIKAFNKEWEERLSNDEKIAAKQAEMQLEIAHLGDDAIHTKSPMGIPLAMFQRLTRYQGIISRMCKKMRLLKTVVTWEEGAVSFWITFCFLVTGLVSLLLPWAFILTWTGRFVVWGMLGPHMALVDCWLCTKGNVDDVLEAAVQNFKKESRFARIRRQEALKLRDMKSLAFGKYITLVPSHNLSRHVDRPLSSSSARLHKQSNTSIKLAPRGIPGQQLSGKILPKTESEALNSANDFAELARKQLAVLKCISAIRDTEKNSRLKRILHHAAQDELKTEAGYEVVPCSEEMAQKSVRLLQLAGTQVEISSLSNSKLSICSLGVAAPDSVPVPAKTESVSTKQAPAKDNKVSETKTTTRRIERGKSRRKGIEQRKGSRILNHKSNSDAQSRKPLSFCQSQSSSSPRLPTLTEADDECRECGEVEVLLASGLFVRDLPYSSGGEEDSTSDDDDSNNGDGPVRGMVFTSEANVEWNGCSRKLAVADDATVDLGSLFEMVDIDDSCRIDDDLDENQSTTSCIIFVQQERCVSMENPNIQARTVQESGDSSETSDYKDACLIPENVSFDDAPFSSNVSCMTALSRS